MRGFVLGLSLSVAFIAGSLFGSLGESTADAQQGRQRWELKCVGTESNRPRGWTSQNSEMGTRLGQEGWEFVEAPADGAFLCFKRAL